MTVGQGEFKPIPSMKRNALFVRLVVTVRKGYKFIILPYSQWLGFGADWAGKKGQRGSDSEPMWVQWL